MEDRLSAHLDECLAALEAGDSIESCLARYPDEAADLAPLLRIALALNVLPQPGPSKATARTAKAHFLAESERRQESVSRGHFRQRLTDTWQQLIRDLAAPQWTTRLRPLATVVTSLVFLLLIGGGVIHAASGSLPGDPLYGFKLLGEDMQRALAISQDSRIRLDQTLAERRVDEVRQLLTAGRQEEVTFSGLLQARNGNRWQVDEIPVLTTEQTQVHKEADSGLFVKIHGSTEQDGIVMAHRIEIEGDTIIGRVDSIRSLIWRVAGHELHINRTTYIQVGIQEGDCVRVRTRRFSPDTLLALEIAVQEGCSGEGAAEDEFESVNDTPTPTVPPTAIPENPIVAPSLTPTSTPAPSPTQTAPPSATSPPKATITTGPTPVPEEDAATPTIQPPSPTSAAPRPTATEPAEDDDNGNQNEGDPEDEENENDGDDNENEDDHSDDGEASVKNGDSLDDKE